MLPSYPKVYTLGHRAIAELFFDPIIVQEKIDGSQISFGFVDGHLQIKSHHQMIDQDNPGMFEEAVKEIKDLENELVEGWIYRGEYLRKPHHNTLVYSRTPKHHIILFDITTGLEHYKGYSNVADEAERLDLETVPTFENKMITSVKELEGFLERESILGGTTIEGVVCKNYERFGRDKHVLMGKYVSERFKEMNGATHKIHKQKDILGEIGDKFRTEARWEKSIQSLKEQGKLINEPKDIGLLLKTINQDVLEECQDEIKELLFKWGWKTICKKITAGFPEFYKKKLAESQFGESND